MATETTNRTDEGTRPTWKLVGPGLVVAATGVGAADLVATLVAGSKFGYALLWAVVVGCVMKIVLVEGAGRYSWPPATHLRGLAQPGHVDHCTSPPTSSSGASSTAPPPWPAPACRSTRCFPVLPVTGLGHPLRAHRPRPRLVGAATRSSRRSGRLVGVMFVTMVGAALLTLPNLPELVTGLAPHHPRRGAGQRPRPWPAASAAPSPWRPTATGSARRAGPPRATCGSCASTTRSPTSSPASSSSPR